MALDILEKSGHARPSSKLMMKLSQIEDGESIDNDRMSDSAYLLSVNGFSINCNYSVVLTIKLQQKGMFGGTSTI